MSSGESEDELRYQALLALSLGGGHGLAELLAALRDDSWRVRKVAVDRLVGELPVALVVPRLIEALADPDSASLRNSALEALVRLGAAVVPELRTALPSAPSDVRKFVLDALGEIRSEAALPALIAARSDSDPNVRCAAVEALGKLGSGAATDELQRIVASDQLDLRLAALDALGRSAARVPFALLQPHLWDRYLRRVAVRALGRSSGPAAQQATLEAVLDPMRGTREAALAALAGLRGESAASWKLALEAFDLKRRAELAKVARELLGAEEVAAAAGAATLLGWLGDAETAVPLLFAAEREELRASLRQAFVSLGPAVVPLLDDRFGELPTVARAFALESLGAMALSEGGAAGPAASLQAGAQALALRSLEEDEDELRLAAIGLLGVVGDLSAADELLPMLAEPATAEVAVQALGQIGDRLPREIHNLCRQGLAVSGDIRPALLRLLGRVGTADDLPTLRAALRGGSAEERRGAAEGLAALKLPEGTNLLRTALTDEDPGVRLFAARGLAANRSPEALGALLAALNDSDELVAAAAADGLGEGGLPAAAAQLAALLERSLSERTVVALAALTALAHLGAADPRVVELAARSPDPEVAKAALRIAARQGLWPTVHALATHPRWDVRSEAATALAQQGGSAARALLQRMGENEPDPMAGKAVAAALAAIAGPRNA